MIEKDIKRVDLKKELETNKLLGGKTVKVPILSSIRIVDGEVIGEIEGFKEVPDYLISDKIIKH